MNNRMDINEEDERNIDDNEIPEKETNLTEDKQTTELQDSAVDHKLDESCKKSIISMFTYNIYINNEFYLNTVCVEIRAENEGPKVRTFVRLLCIRSYISTFEASLPHLL